MPRISRPMIRSFSRRSSASISAMTASNCASVRCHGSPASAPYSPQKNHCWREGPPRTSPAKFRSAGRAFTLPGILISFKREYNCSPRCVATSPLRTLAGYQSHLGDVLEPLILDQAH